MRQSICLGVLSAILCVLLPFAAALALPAGADAPAQAAEGTEPAGAGVKATDAPLQPGFDEGFRLLVEQDGQCVETDLQTYLTGVILAELPASFEPQAKRAQAVASRTYALRRCANPRHGQAAVCTNPACCQAWVDPASADPDAAEAARLAVSDTDGMVILYDGALIDATFFSCSGGMTEQAAAVWGSDVPYLQAVASPGEQDAAYDHDELCVPLADFKAAILAEAPEADLSGPPQGWAGALSATPGGGVATLELGGVPFTGQTLRRLFGLRSTAFTLNLSEDGAVFQTRGYGHRVGLSQYGANAMALDGHSWQQILQWYYQGVELGPYPG